MHYLFLFSLVFCSYLTPLFAEENSKIRIELFQGKEIEVHAQEVIDLCHMIYREAPYYYNGDDAGCENYWKSYYHSADAVTCLVFDDETAVGLGIGLPALETRDFYIVPFQEKGYDINDFFYIGEFGLNPKYRNREIEEEMQKKIEAFAREHKYSKICLWEIEDRSSHIENVFWKKVGFVQHPDLNFSIDWTDIGNTESTPHLAIFWIKEKI